VPLQKLVFRLHSNPHLCCIVLYWHNWTKPAPSNMHVLCWCHICHVGRGFSLGCFLLLWFLNSGFLCDDNGLIMLVCLHLRKSRVQCAWLYNGQLNGIFNGQLNRWVGEWVAGGCLRRSEVRPELRFTEITMVHRVDTCWCNKNPAANEATVTSTYF